MTHPVTFLRTIPRPELRCHCARLCTCACHTLPGLKHLEPCCGPHSQVHVLFCTSEVECLTK